MAPSPEYDKEPKAPDKSSINISSEDPKTAQNQVPDQQSELENKHVSSVTNADGEINQHNQHIGNLDEDKLRALLNEAFTYKCPKDREGKSSLFKELLEEVEQDEQACEAAARAGARARRGRRGRALPHSNSLQDLVAALTTDAAPRRASRTVAARALHGGSLPSGVDTSFLLGEECGPRGGYLATVRCVNPPPLAERRVSGDAAEPGDLDLLNRRSKPFPLTYTARATLEIGSGAVGSGRAVTTTTASNQVRTLPRANRLLSPTLDKQQTLMNALRPPEDGDGTNDLCTQESHKVRPRGPPIARNEHVGLEISVEETKNNYISSQPSKQRDNNMLPNLQVHNKDKLNTSTMGRVNEEKHINSATGKTNNDQGKRKGKNKHDNRPLEKLPLPTDREKESVLHSNSCKNTGLNSKLQPPPSDKETTKNSKSTKKFHNDLVNNTGVSISSSSRIPDADPQWKYNLNQWYDGISSYKSFGIVPGRNLNEELNSNNNEPIRGITGTKTNLKVASEGDLHPSIDDRIAKDADVSPYSITSEYLINSGDTGRRCADGVPQIKVSLDRVKRNTCVIVSDSDISLRKKYRERVGNLVPPSLSDLNPKNVRSMSVGNPVPSRVDLKLYNTVDVRAQSKMSMEIQKREEDTVKTDITCDKGQENVRPMSVGNAVPSHLDLKDKTIDNKSTEIQKNEDTTETVCDRDSPVIALDISSEELTSDRRVEERSLVTEHSKDIVIDIELLNLEDQAPTFVEDTKDNIEMTDMSSSDLGTNSFTQYYNSQQRLLKILEENADEDAPTRNPNNEDSECFDHSLFKENLNADVEGGDIKTLEDAPDQELQDFASFKETSNISEDISEDEQGNETKEIVLKLNTQPNHNATGEQYVLAELPNNAYIFLTLPKRSLTQPNQGNNNFVKITEIENNNKKPYVTGDNRNGDNKKNKKKKEKKTSKDAVKSDALNKKALKVLLFEDLYKDTERSGDKPVSSLENEVDSAIPFSCITTPKVVASCNTTASTTQSAVAVDPKPLQLASCYRAVASLTSPTSVLAEPVAAPAPVEQIVQPRSVISSTFNGLPLSRPNYGSTGTTTTDEYKKSLDENGNSLQGYSSPSSQLKKPRRKKSSKNETVITSHQIDGYQGNKDLNEVLRFIESNADNQRGHKLGRAKHKDDDDKGKKRSSERRKDKESKPQRATSMEELSRTTLADLTDKPPPAKPERRSWGDAARDDFFLPPEPAEPELTDFQTVTKKRKPRRRTEDPRRSPPPAPRRRESAPPSERSDSNDDLDSLTSQPPPAPPHASYADIARARHNIPDLIESCNFYEDPYPALEPRPPPPPPRRPADKPPAPPPPGPLRKESMVRARGAAPDVVVDRRPAVVLRPAPPAPDLSGVTFGFDINHTLVATSDCDLVHDAVCVGGAGLRWVSPGAPDPAQLASLVTYVAHAWEDVLRCGTGKVRYFSD